MQAFAVLADPVRRRVLEILGAGEVAAGAVTEVIGREFGISQPATSQHLRVLRDAGLVEVRAEGTRRLYRVNADVIAQVATWFDQFANPWRQPLDALGTEIARGQRARRATGRSARSPRDTAAG